MIPPKENAEFVAAMEDVLEVYRRPYNSERPVVCMDEQSKQLVKQTRPIIAAKPGRNQRLDYEYERNGTANLFMRFEPLGGRRRVKVTDRRTKIDFAYVLREMVDNDYPDAEVIVLVMDNLNTHKPASLYEAFEPAEARRLIEKLEIHYTPKHGSWLNMAETELSHRDQAMPQSSHSRYRHAPPRDHRLGASTQPGQIQNQLAVRHSRRTDQTTKTLPVNSDLKRH